MPGSQYRPRTNFTGHQYLDALQLHLSPHPVEEPLETDDGLGPTRSQAAVPDHLTCGNHFLVPAAQHPATGQRRKRNGSNADGRLRHLRMAPLVLQTRWIERIVEMV